jgi:alkylation response protein AidB-like acyl-CoA dehydrogenase
MITFALTEDQQMVQELVRKFAQEELRPQARTMEKARAVPAELEKKFDALQLGLVDVPEALGGLGLGSLTAVLVHEELAFGDPGAAVALWRARHAPAVVELGGAAALLAGRGALAWTDRKVETHARREGNEWILDGEKAWVIGGDSADKLIVFTAEGAFVVDGKAVGLTRAGRHEWLGLETAHVVTLAFKGCRAEARLEAEPAALRRMFARLQLATAARQVGLARASYEFALNYTQERVAFGKPVAHFQAVSFTLADMHMEVESARWMVWRAAAELDAGAPDALVNVAKAAVHANDAAWRVADNGVQLLGGAGFIQDYPVEKWMRDTKALAMIGGNDQLSQLVIAGLDDGLPTSSIQPVVT